MYSANTIIAAKSLVAVPMMATHWMWVFPAMHASDAIILAVRYPHYLYHIGTE
jgi:hypothetical protein